jgi:hypothetical protein
MDTMKVKELMRSVEEFPRISSSATFLEAVDALDEADLAFREGRAPERIVLVFDEQERIAGKISPIDVVKALEPNYPNIENINAGYHRRLMEASFESMKEQYWLWHKPLSKLRDKAERIKVRDFITMPKLHEMVCADDTVDVAFKLFMTGRLGSAFVLKNERIVGLIRFSDIYRKIKSAMRYSPGPQKANAMIA